MWEERNTQPKDGCKYSGRKAEVKLKTRQKGKKHPSKIKQETH